MSQNHKRILFVSLGLFMLLTLIAAWQGEWKLVSISWIAFLAMALAIPLGVRAAEKKNLNSLIAGYGLASGAMITSAAIFLVPSAINHSAVYGGLGIALGIMTGFAIHTLSHSLVHHSIMVPPVVMELTSHALAGGIVMGMVYAAMPSLGLLLGVAIVSHKGPAGYAASRRLAMQGKPVLLLLLPACAIGLTAMSVSMLHITEIAVVNALIFGFATGIFFHVAIDFLPECEVGGKIHQETHLQDHEHHKLDQYRHRAVIYTFVGGLIVFLAWYAAY